jgi:hypothetical protein
MPFLRKKVKHSCNAIEHPKNYVLEMLSPGNAMSRAYGGWLGASLFPQKLDLN